MTKKLSKTYKKKEGQTMSEEIQEHIVEQINNEAKKAETTATTEVTQELKRYRFIAKCANLNISNVIFNGVKVVIYETNAATYTEAFKVFQKNVLKMFNNNITNYNTFMKSVFGQSILVEIIPTSAIREEVATFDK